MFHHTNKDVYILDAYYIEKHNIMIIFPDDSPVYILSIKDNKVKFTSKHHGIHLQVYDDDTIFYMNRDVLFSIALQSGDSPTQLECRETEIQNKIFRCTINEGSVFTVHHDYKLKRSRFDTSVPDRLTHDSILPLEMKGDKYDCTYLHVDERCILVSMHKDAQSSNHFNDRLYHIDPEMKSVINSVDMKDNFEIFTMKCAHVGNEYYYIMISQHTIHVFGLLNGHLEYLKHTHDGSAHYLSLSSSADDACVVVSNNNLLQKINLV